MLPTGTVTFLFTDIEGSTPLWEQMPTEMQAAVAQHHAILREAIEANGGHVFQILGDAFQAAFRLASQSLCAALEAQRRLQAAEWGPTGSLRVRMGIHTGPAELDPIPGPSGVHEYAICHTLNRAARVMSAGHGGQILVSREAADLVERELPRDASLRDMGEHHLKGMQRLEHLYQVVVPDLPHDFPPLVTSVAHPNNLPLQLTSFIGRQEEITRIQELLTGSNARLVTLAGTGGMGKTRLSLQAAEGLIEEFPGGVWLVELAPLAEATFVPSAVASTLNVRETSGQPVARALEEYIATKSMLLIFDNCEHVVEAAAALAHALLRACPHLRILATSRETLEVEGETVFRCPPLLVPNPTQPQPLSAAQVYAAALTSDAIRLFAERAQSASPGFTLSEKNASSIMGICQRLEGIPLAIELAAARVRLLSVEQIAARLDDVFNLLTSGKRSTLPRHQTLKALVDWSYHLLAPPEQALLRRLSVFAGGWDLPAAEAVVSGGVIEPWQVLELMGQLVNKSLVLVETVEAGDNRYRMLETIRKYAYDCLVEAGEGNELHRQHLNYFLNLAGQAELHMFDKEEAEWLRRLTVEKDNIRAAMQWALNNETAEVESRELGARMAASLLYAWINLGALKEGQSWITDALQRIPQPGRTRARLLTADGTFAWQLGLLPAAADRLCQSIDLFRQLEDRPGLAESTHIYGHIILDQQNYPEAKRVFQESLAIYESLGDRTIRITLLNDLGLAASFQGDYSLAKRYYEDSLALSIEHAIKDGQAASYIRLGDIARLQDDYEKADDLYEKSLKLNRASNLPLEIACSLHKLGFTALYQGNSSQAQTRFCESLAIQQEACNQQGIAECLAGLASVKTRQKDYEDAARYFGAARQIFTRTGLPIAPADLVEWQRDEAEARSKCDPNRFEQAWSRGMAEPLEEIISSSISLAATQ